jgi:hypothetical protein
MLQKAQTSEHDMAPLEMAGAISREGTTAHADVQLQFAFIVTVPASAFHGRHLASL